MHCREETKPIHAGEVGRTSNNQHPTSKPEYRFTAVRPQEGDLDKLA
jgi:hypothetical protein